MRSTTPVSAATLKRSRCRRQRSASGRPCSAFASIEKSKHPGAAMKRRLLLQGSAAALLPLTARADAFPDHPLRYIVPVPAGGGSDMIGRVVTERWGKLLGQPFVVENQGGGGG